MYNFSVSDPHFLPHCGCQLELDTRKGDFITLVGENGVGKSTLARRLYQEHSQIMSYVQQEAMDLFYDRSLNQLKRIFLSSRASDISHERFHWMWEEFNFSKKEQRLQSELSGGEGQALKICLGLAIEKEIYLLDEPSQFLDHAIKEKLNLLLEKMLLQKKTLLMIEHDFSWVKFHHTISELIIQDGNLSLGKTWTT